MSYFHLPRRSCVQEIYERIFDLNYVLTQTFNFIINKIHSFQFINSLLIHEKQLGYRSEKRNIFCVTNIASVHTERYNPNTLYLELYN